MEPWRRNRRLGLLAALAALLILSASGLEADRVVLVDGRTFDGASCRFVDDRAQISLPDGGRLEIGAARVARVEIDPVRATLDPPALVTPADPAPRFDPRYRPGAEVLFRSQFDDWIVGLAARHDLHPALVSAVTLAST